MILKRLAEGIRDQDWFVVMVEIMIVVVGIFIGLQVDDWNEERKDRIEGQVYIERLLEDMSGDLDLFERVLSEIRTKRQALVRVERAIRSQDIGDQTPDEFFRILKSSVDYGWRVPQVRSVTFDDLQNTGRLSLIKNTALRSEISQYYGDALHRSQRISTRNTGYAHEIYELVDSRANVAIGGVELARISESERQSVQFGATASLTEEDSTMILAEFLLAAADQQTLRLLNAEESYSAFLEQAINQQLLDLKRVMERLDEAQTSVSS